MTQIILKAQFAFPQPLLLRLATIASQAEAKDPALVV